MGSSSPKRPVDVLIEAGPPFAMAVPGTEPGPKPRPEPIPMPMPLPLPLPVPLALPLLLPANESGNAADWDLRDCISSDNGGVDCDACSC